MKIELLYLLLTAILTGVLWIPVVIGYVKTRGPLTDESYKVAPTSPLPPWVSRANRAHVNAVENFAPFAAVVLVRMPPASRRRPPSRAPRSISMPASPTPSFTSAAPGSSRRARSCSRSPGSRSSPTRSSC